MAFHEALIGKSSNQFGFYVFPLELYQSGELAVSEELATRDGLVTVTVSGLTRLTTSRLPYSIPF